MRSFAEDLADAHDWERSKRLAAAFVAQVFPECVWRAGLEPLRLIDWPPPVSPHKRRGRARRS